MPSPSQIYEHLTESTFWRFLCLLSVNQKASQGLRIKSFLQLTSKILRRSYKHILLPALPSMCALWLSSLIALSDAFIAGKIGIRSLAAMGFCEQAWQLFGLFIFGLS